MCCEIFVGSFCGFFVICWEMNQYEIVDIWCDFKVQFVDLLMQEGDLFLIVVSRLFYEVLVLDCCSFCFDCWKVDVEWFLNVVEYINYGFMVIGLIQVYCCQVVNF